MSLVCRGTFSSSFVPGRLTKKTLSFFRIITIFVLSLGTLHIDESVFAFILNRKSGQFLNSGIEHHDRHLVWQLMPSGISHTGVECCLSELWQSRATDSINELLHTFFVLQIPFLEQGWK